MPRARSSGKSTSVAARPRVVLRTPYPTLRETARTLGVSAAKAAAIRDGVREELIRFNRETGQLELLEPKPGGPLSLELASGRVVRRVRTARPARRSTRAGGQRQR